MSSKTTAEVVVFTPKASFRDEAILFSLTPNLILDFLLMGRFSVKKVINYSVGLPSIALIALARATGAESNG
jgi:hypothetical protein